MNKLLKKIGIIFIVIVVIVLAGNLFWNYIYHHVIPPRYTYNNCPGDSCVNCGWDDKINGNCDPEYNPYKENGIYLDEERLNDIMEKHNLTKEQVLNYVQKELEMRENQQRKYESKSRSVPQSYINEIQRLKKVQEMLLK